MNARPSPKLNGAPPASVTKSMLMRFRLAACMTLSFCCFAAACGPDEPTGYVVDIRIDKFSIADLSSTDSVQLSISSLTDSGFGLNATYPKAGTIELKQGRVAQVAIDIDSQFDQRRRFWVRAKQGEEVIAEGASEGSFPPVKGQRRAVVVQLQRGALPNSDTDEVPDAVDNCPQSDNPDQSNCTSLDGGVSADAEVVDNSPIVTDARMAPDAPPVQSARGTSDGATDAR